MNYKGIYMKLDKSKGLEVHVDADFVGNWDPQEIKNSTRQNLGMGIASHMQSALSAGKVSFNHILPSVAVNPNTLDLAVH